MTDHDLETIHDPRGEMVVFHSPDDDAVATGRWIRCDEGLVTEAEP